MSEKKYLAQVFPDFLHEWDYDKNTISPYEISAFSKQKVWWICSGCGYSWETGVYTRTRMNCGCPNCAKNKSRDSRIARIISEKGSFATNYPELLYLWDYDANDVSPQSITPVSNKLYWWKCTQGHKWQSNIGNLKKAKNCPVCFNRKLLKGYNDLETRYPKIAEEWNYEKNDFLPSEVLYGSDKTVWWKCKRCGTEWQQKLAIRTRLLTGCPKCNSYSQISRPEKCIAYYLVKSGLDIEENYKLFKNYTLDVFIPEKNIAIEYDGQEWHQDINRDLKKNKLCEKQRIKLYRIREPELQDLNSTSIDIKVDELKSTLDYMTDVIKTLFKELKIDYSDIDVKRDELDILSYMELYKKKNSIIYCFPNIAKEWNYEKNGILKPEFFSKGSRVKVWWTCPVGHDYKQEIANRANGAGCPYCSGHQVLKGFNDLETLYPELANEWNYKKNKNKSPDSIVSGSGIIVWWICEKGHEWKAKPLDRTRHSNGCPYCENKKILSGYNDLVTTRPDLVEEWDYDKNVIDPSTIFAGTNKKAWWICKKCGNNYESKIIDRNRGRGCPKCASESRPINIRLTRVKMYGSLIDNNPKLVEEWNYEKNNISPAEIGANSNIKVWWKCPLGHNYESSVNNRAGGKGCPYCSNQKILIGFNDLETTNKELLAEWDYEKNSVSPRSFTSGTNTKVWWKCLLGHHWQASISSRVRENGCPVCAGKIVKKGFNDLVTANPDIANEWDYDKNEGLKPTDVTAGSNKKVWWKCIKGHEWITAICLRTSQDTGCPYCAGRKIFIGFNDLKSVHPNLAEEWDYEKNELTPDKVVYGSGKRVWWICPRCNYSWASAVVNRTKRKSGCPKCKYNWYNDNELNSCE